MATTPTPTFPTKITINVSLPTSAEFPFDISTVANAQPGSAPHPGRDQCAKLPKDSTCPGCTHYRARDDWEHNRIIGECSYPYDEQQISICNGCQQRKQRHHPGHSYVDNECRWAAAPQRTSAKCSNPHEPRTKIENEPTATAPGTLDGEELEQKARKILQQKIGQQSLFDPPTAEVRHHLQPLPVETHRQKLILAMQSLIWPEALNLALGTAALSGKQARTQSDPTIVSIFTPTKWFARSGWTG